MTFQEAIMSDEQRLSDYLNTTTKWDVQDYITVDNKKAPYLYVSESEPVFKRFKSIEKNGLVCWGDHGWLCRVQAKGVKFHYIVYLGTMINPEKVEWFTTEGRVNIETGEVQ